MPTEYINIIFWANIWLTERGLSNSTECLCVRFHASQWPNPQRLLSPSTWYRRLSCSWHWAFPCWHNTVGGAIAQVRTSRRASRLHSPASQFVFEGCSDDFWSSYIADGYCWLQGRSLYFGFLSIAFLTLIMNSVSAALIIKAITWRKADVSIMDCLREWINQWDFALFIRRCPTGRMTNLRYIWCELS